MSMVLHVLPLTGNTGINSGIVVVGIIVVVHLLLLARLETLGILEVVIARDIKLGRRHGFDVGVRLQNG